jgi:hypothetical protein
MQLSKNSDAGTVAGFGLLDWVRRIELCKLSATSLRLNMGPIAQFVQPLCMPGCDAILTIALVCKLIDRSIKMKRRKKFQMTAMLRPAPAADILSAVGVTDVTQSYESI